VNESESHNGQLYSASGAKHPEAIPALKGRKLRRSMKNFPIRSLTPDSTHSPMESGDGLSAAKIYLYIFGITVVFGSIESFTTKHIGWLTLISFAAVSIYSAVRSAPVAGWAAWTAAPLSFAITVLMSVKITNATFGNFIITQASGLVLGLSDHAWVIVGVTAVCWAIGRRREIASRRDHRHVVTPA